MTPHSEAEFSACVTDRLTDGQTDTAHIVNNSRHLMYLMQPKTHDSLLGHSHMQTISLPVPVCLKL